MIKFWNILTKTIGTIVVLCLGLTCILYAIDELTKKPVATIHKYDDEDDEEFLNPDFFEDDL